MDKDVLEGMLMAATLFGLQIVAVIVVAEYLNKWYLLLTPLVVTLIGSAIYRLIYRKDHSN